jgi:galactokinase
VSRQLPNAERALATGRKALGSAWRPEKVAEAPGRLELLGNHVDYSGGKVIAAAIDRTVVVALSKKPQDASIDVAFADTGDSEPLTLSVEHLNDWRNEGSAPEPSDYVRGAIAALMGRGAFDANAGYQIAVSGDVPIGLGLSSSAALCVALSLAISAKPLAKRDVVLIAQEAEHRAGTPCGTMDQSASVAGGIILFDSATVTFEQLSPDLGDLAFAVADSGVTRSLGASSYPTRVAESKEALAIAKRELQREVSSLAELSIPDLDTLSKLEESRMPPTIFRRLRHIVSENDRVREGYKSLQEADWPRFGVLMTASGRSSALDYEISHPRVEALVAQSLEVDGVLGARMMGGGEGGTALILVRKSSIPDLERRLADGYYAEHEMEPGVHVFQNADGASLNVVL